MRFDEAGRQYESQRNVFLADGTTLAFRPHGDAHRRRAGGQLDGQQPHRHGRRSPAAGSSYVLTRTIFDAGGRTVATLADNTAPNDDRLMTGPTAESRSPTPWATSSPITFDAAGNLIFSTRTEICTITAASVDHRDVLLGHVLRLPEPAGPPGRARGRRQFSTPMAWPSVSHSGNCPFWKLSSSTLVT